MSTLEQQIEGYALSPQQKRLFRDLTPGSPAPWNRCAVSIRGPLDPERLHASLRALQERHEILRTGYEMIAGLSDPVQTIAETGLVLFESSDLEPLDPDDREPTLERSWDAIASPSGRDRENSNTPSLRAHLLRLGADQHLLLLGLSTLQSDGPTLPRLAAELSDVYAAGGEAGEIDEDALQYVQFAEWQNELLESEDSEAAFEFWQQRNLAGHEPAPLPFQRVSTSGRPPLQVWSTTLPADLGDRVDTLAEDAEVTPGNVLFTAWASLLGRLLAADDLVLGLTVDGRKYEEIDAMPGPLAQVLPVRADLAPSSTFAEALSQLAQDSEEATEWQEGWAGARGASTPWRFGFEALDALVETEDEGLTWQLERLDSQLERFDLELAARRLPTGWTCDFRFDAGSLAEASVRDLADAFLTLLTAALDAPESALADLPILSVDTREGLIHAWNQAETESATDFSIAVHQRFAAQAQRTPDATAVEFTDAENQIRHLSYRDLDTSANRLARTLAARGVGREDLVALLVEPSPDLLIALLAVLKTGAAYLPLDPIYPAERLGFMIEDAGVGVVLSEPELAATLPEVPATVLTLAEVLEASASETDTPLDVAIESAQLAYVIYTSGSTGKPKGTLVPHGGVSNYLAWAETVYPLAQGGGAPLHSSIAFDLTVTSVFLPLLTGRAVVLAASATHVEGLAAALRARPENGFSLVKLTPGHLRVLGQQLETDEIAGSSRSLILGGEALLGEDLAVWRRADSETRFFNEYGPTETVVGCCIYESGSSLYETERVPIGRPIANTQVYVRDSKGDLAFPGLPGELFIGGAGVTRGYLGRPSLTAERFVPDPWSTMPGARLYRTGDMVRLLPDGELDYLGRQDEQVKIRGFRVELGEIETLMRQHASVDEAVVMVRRDDLGNERLTAYLVFKDRVVADGSEDAAPSIRAWRELLGAQLPDYMVPVAFVTLDALPLTRNGKVDRAALPEPDRVTSADHVAPRTVEEEILAGIWCQVLGLDRAGIDDDYFALGGDSIRSIQVVALADEKGLTCTLDQIFKHRTIRRLAIAMRDQAAKEDIGDTFFGLISAEDKKRLDANQNADQSIEDAYPLSQLQAGMIFHHEATSGLYHDIFSFHVRGGEGPLDIERLRRGLELLVARHPALRTTFELGRLSEPYQLIHSRGVVQLEVDDLRDLGAEAQQTAIETWIDDERQRDFDLARLPLIRYQVHLRGDDHFQFSVSFHHAILDGWSDATMLTEIAISYMALARNETLPFESPQTRHRQFVALERQALASEAARGFWRDKLHGLPSTQLPRQIPADAAERSGVWWEVPISDAVSDGLKALARDAAVPIKNVLMASHLRVLSFLSGSSDVLTCVTSSGRPETADGERVLGLFLNSMPLRADLRGGSWRELVSAAFAEERDALVHRRFPLAEMQRWYGERKLSETSFYFTHYHVYHDMQRLAGFELVDVSFHEETSFALVSNFRVDPFSSKVRLDLTLNGQWFTDEQIARFGEYFGRVLEAMALRPDHRYEHLHLLTEAEQAQLTGWSAGADTTPTVPHLLAGFARQAAATPERTALVAADGTAWTFAELRDQAARRAGWLRAQGFGVESRVGLLLERSPRLVAAMLGTLAAGAAYVPLDPAYPDSRLANMVEDAGVGLVLASPQLADRLPEGVAVETVAVETVGAEPVHADTDISWDVDSGDQLAYVIYTSGSTGRPKGVMISHAQLASYLNWALATYPTAKDGDGGGSVVHTSTSFDLTVTSLFVPLLSGEPAILVGDDAGPRGLAKALAKRPNLSFVKLTPSHARLLAQEDEFAAIGRAARALILGGEALDASMLARYADEAPDTVIYNEYGPTETVVGCIVDARAAGDLGPGAVPIGRPIAGAQIALVDRFLQRVPPRVPGEIVIGGPAVARGYLDRPALTAARFVPDPFSSDGGRLYRTGDLARYRDESDRDDGVLEYLGRGDEQVKVRGYRIELGEIEAALVDQVGVTQAAVLARTSEDGAQLVAYAVPEPGVALDWTALRAQLEATLPEYMVPARFVSLDALPLTPNGKLDRAALPEPAEDRAASEVPYAAPRNEREEILAALWSQALGVDQVGIDDDYFALGGDSIRSIKVVSQGRERGLSFQLDDLFKERTIRRLSAAIEAGGTAELPHVEPFGLVRDEDRPRLVETFGDRLADAYPISRLQIGMIYHRELHPDSAVYHDLFSFQLRAPFDADAARQAITGVLERHPALRTAFDLANFSEPMQLVHAEPVVDLKIEDLRELSAEAQEEVLDRWRRGEHERGFDLTQLPLIRYAVHRRTDTTFQFSFDFHHAIMDGWSDATMLTEIGLSYQHLVRGEEPPFQVPRSTVRDYMAVERQTLQDGGARDYWQAKLAGSSYHELPRRLEEIEPAPPGSRGVLMWKAPITDELSDGLQQTARRLALPVKSLLLAAHMRVLEMLGGGRDIVTTMSAAGRLEVPDGERVLGLFLNSTPFRQALPGGTWAELAASCFDTERDALPYRRFPMAEVSHLLGRSLAETHFYYTHYHIYRQLQDDPDFEVLEIDGYEEISFSLAAMFGIHGFSGRVRLQLNVDRTKVSQAQLDEISGYYMRALAAIAERPDERYDATALLSDAERAQLTIFNETRTPRGLAQGDTVLARFFAQVARVPEALAVRIEAADGSNRDLTYADLDRRSAQLANLLAARGIGAHAPEQRVGVAIERSLELMVAIVATLRSGATYVPLDVSYPEGRLRFMAEDSNLSLILTQPNFEERIARAAEVATLALDAQWTELADQPWTFEDALPTRQQAAYMIYTSGSTGRPKGVVNTHGALANRLTWGQERYPLAVGDRVLQKTPIGFDVSVWELLWPFMTGAALVLARPGGHKEPVYLAEILDRQEISTAHFVPSMLRGFLTESNAESPCRRLRQVICSGEALPTELVHRFYQRFQPEQVALDNLYGPAEAAIEVTSHRCRTDEQGSVPIGAPIDNLALHVVTPFFQTAPRGVSGELLIGGVGLARGYHDRPALTAERFVPDPWSAEPGARVYRTGDRARWLANGELDFLGRLDFQIKLRGVRIELGEVEAVLEEHPGIDAAAVTVEDGERLVAYVVATGEELPEIRLLREHLQTRLPEAMTPSDFIALDALPLSPNGKIDRRALAEAGGVRIEHRVPYEAPRTDLEKELAALFADILGRDTIGIRDPFFELGGNSLNVTQLLSRVRQNYRVELTLSTFFEGPNVAHLALGIEAAQRAAASQKRQRSDDTGREVGAL